MLASGPKVPSPLPANRFFSYTVSTKPAYQAPGATSEKIWPGARVVMVVLAVVRLKEPEVALA